MALSVGLPFLRELAAISRCSSFLSSLPTAVLGRAGTQRDAELAEPAADFLFHRHGAAVLRCCGLSGSGNSMALFMKGQPR
jgi:hypothetical protein